MKHYLTAQKLVLTLALLACSICIFSFRQNETTQQKTFRKGENFATNDTTTRRKRNRDNYEFRVNDIENAMSHLDEQMMRLDEQMKKMDFSKMEKQIQQATKIDHEKIAKDVEASLAKIDWKKMQADIQQSTEKIRKVDMIKMQSDLEKMKADLAKQNFDVKINAKEIRESVAKAMEGAKESMEKAKVEIQLMKEFTNELQKDGLIDKKKNQKIEVRDGELYIDDKKQPKEVSDKYRKYYRKSNYSIRTGSDGVSI